MAAINTTETPFESPWNGEATPSMTRPSYFEVEMGFEESSPGEASPSSAEAVMEALEAAGLGEDHEFQVAPEGLAAEAPETHETLQERLPEYHFASMASQEWPSEDHFTSVASEAEALLERFFERIQGYEGEALTEAEIERAIAEIAPPHDPFAPASEQFLGKLVRSVGNFVSKTVKTVTHAVADVSSSVADTLGKVPILGSGLKGLYGYTYGALIQAADNVVSGVRLDKAASRYLESQVQNVRELAPYVQAVISLVPGIGPGVSGAISAGLSLAQGRSIDQALVDAAVGALPGGALVQSAAKMTYAAASGKPISDIAVAALPLSPAAKEGLKAGLRVASDLAQGKRVDKTLLAEANRQVERLPPQFRSAAQVGIALGQGKRLQDVAATQLPRLIAVGGPLAAMGQKIASQSPVVQRARRLLAREGQHGFDVAQGLMAHSGASVNQMERARAALRGEALNGFERAVALHGGYALPKARVVPPPRPVKGTPAPAPARIRTLGRAITARAPGVRASGPSAPTPLIRRPEVVAAVQPLPTSSVSDSGPTVPLDEPASMPSDEPAVVPSDQPTAMPTSDVTTSSAATCPSCGAPQVADAADSGSDSEPADGAVTSAEPAGDVSLASTPTVDEMETPFELSWMAEPPTSEMHQPDSFALEGSSELGEVAPSPPRSAPEYVRWVQSALNRALGTKLIVDGRGSPATRAAVAQFQRGHKLNPDGVVDPATEFALVVASGSSALATAGGTGSAAASRARYARWSDTDDRRKGRNPRDQDIFAADPQGASKVLEFPVPGDRSRRIFLLQNFKVDGASLRPEHKQYLEGLAKWIRLDPQRGWQVFAEAHASRTGTERHDDLLSEDRYLVTRAFLESQLLRAGVDAARLRMYGDGVGFRHSPLPGEDPRARSVYVVVQPDPSPSPPTPWPPPIIPVVFPPRPRPGPRPTPPPIPVPADPWATLDATQNFLLFPATPATTREGVLAHLHGGLVTDSSLRARVSVIIGPGATLRGVAERLRPFWVNAATAAGRTPPTVDELARAFAVYGEHYLPVPTMRSWQDGLRMPLPIEIDQANGDWIVNSTLTRTWANQVFQAAWQATLTQRPSHLPIPASASLRTEALALLSQHPTALARGIHLTARALTNPFDVVFLLFETFRQLGANAFDVALEFLNNMVSHQANLLGSLTAGNAILGRLALSLTNVPVKQLSPIQQLNLARGRSMVDQALGTNSTLLVPRELPETAQHLADRPGSGRHRMVFGRDVTCGKIGTFTQLNGAQFNGAAFIGTLPPAPFIHANGALLNPNNNAALASRLRIVDVISVNEGRLDAIRMQDVGILSVGMQQWSAHADLELPALLHRFKQMAFEEFSLFFGLFRLDVRPNGVDGRGNPQFMLQTRRPNGTLTDLTSHAQRVAFFGGTTVGSLTTFRTDWAARSRLATLVSLQFRLGEILEAAARFDRVIRDVGNIRVPGVVGTIPVNQLITSEQGVALVLDAHINQPGHVQKDLENAATAAGVQLNADARDRAITRAYAGIRRTQNTATRNNNINAQHLNVAHGSFVGW